MATRRRVELEVAHESMFKGKSLQLAMEMRKGASETGSWRRAQASTKH